MANITHITCRLLASLNSYCSSKIEKRVINRGVVQLCMHVLVMHFGTTHFLMAFSLLFFFVPRKVEGVIIIRCSVIRNRVSIYFELDQLREFYPTKKRDC